MDELGRLGWAARRSYELDRFVFGVRANSTRFAAWLDGLLGKARVKDDEAEANYSIILGERDSDEGPKPFHILYRGSEVLIRTLDVRLLGRVLLTELESVTFPRRQDALYLEVGFASVNGRSLLVPYNAVPNSDRLVREAARMGLKMPVTTFNAVDLRTGHVVPLPPRLDVAPDALDELAQLASTQPAPRPLFLEKAVRVDGVCCLAAYQDEPVLPFSRANTVYALARQTRNLGVLGGQAALQGLAEAVRDIPCYRIRADSWTGMFEAMHAAAAGTVGLRAPVP